MSAAAADTTGTGGILGDAELLHYCIAVVADAKEKQSLVNEGWLGVVGLPPLSTTTANDSSSYREKWIAENITQSSNIDMLKVLNSQLNRYLKDPHLGNNNYTGPIYSAVSKRIKDLESSSKGGRTKTSKKRTTTRRRRSSKRKVRKARKARTTRRR